MILIRAPDRRLHRVGGRVRELRVADAHAHAQRRIDDHLEVVRGGHRGRGDAQPLDRAWRRRRAGRAVRPVLPQARVDDRRGARRHGGDRHRRAGAEGLVLHRPAEHGIGVVDAPADGRIDDELDVAVALQRLDLRLAQARGERVRRVADARVAHELDHRRRGDHQQEREDRQPDQQLDQREAARTHRRHWQ